MDNSLMAVMLRVWLWLMPIGMFVAAVAFGVIAAVDERWELFGVMIVLAFIAVGLAVLNYWALYRFGKGAGQ